MEDIAGKLVAMDVYEPQTFALMVFGGFFIISSLVYLVSAFGTKEKSYEEAIAEQRAHLESEKISKGETKSKKKSFNARKKKKPESMQEAQVITPAPVVIPVEVPVPPAKTQKQTKQSPKPKADSDSKPDKKVKSAEEKTTPKPTKKEVKKSVPVVEEVFQKTVDKQSFTAPPPPKKEVEVPVKAVQSEHPVKAVQSEQVKSEPSKVKAKPKKEATPVVSSSSVKNLVTGIKAARLSDKEIQQLIDTLLNKQSGPGNADQWTMANQRSDPVSVLKRQLQEKEQQLHNETLSTQASAQKVKEMRIELANEKQLTMKSEMDHKNKMSSLEKDIQALHLRMSQTHEQHAKETSGYQLKMKQLQGMVDESNSGVIQKLREENNMLKTEANRNVAKKEQLMGNELARLQAENSKLQSQLSGNKDNTRKTDELRHSYESRIGQLEKQLQQVQITQNEKENMLSKRLEEMSCELRTAEEQKSSLNRELDAAKNSAKMATTESGKVKQQLQDLQKSSSGESVALSTLENKLKDANAQNDELKSKLKSTMDQVNSGEKTNIERGKQIQDLKNQLSSMNNQVADLKKSLANKTEMDSAINGQVQETESLLKEKESIIIELQEKINGNQSEVEKLKSDIEKQKKKNDALREKNWKAMEAVTAAEKVSEEKVSKALKGVQDQLSVAVTTEQESSRNTLKNIFPELNVDSNLIHSEWLTAFEMQAKESLSSKVKANDQTETVNTLNSQLATAENEKIQLSSQCQHYKKVLADTEKILNQLQASVQSEESKWHDKLLTAEKELNQLKTKLSNEQEKSRKLADDLSKASSSGADNQLTEELDKAKAAEATSKKKLAEVTAELDAARKVSDETAKGVEQLKKDLEATKLALETANEQKGSAGEDSDAISKELQEVKAALQKEKSMTKELGTAAAKLQNMLKKNQSLLTTEREVNKDLKAKLGQIDNGKEEKKAEVSGSAV